MKKYAYHVGMSDGGPTSKIGICSIHMFKELRGQISERESSRPIRGDYDWRAPGCISVGFIP